MIDATTRLVKYCMAEYLEVAINLGKIYIGTFSKYKNIENVALRDLEEGAAIPAIINMDSDQMISEIHNDSLLMHSSIKLANGWKMNLPKGMPLWLEQPTFNTFIFCVSQDENPSIEKAKRLGYDSYYEITDPENFGKAVMQSLMEHLESEYGFTREMGPVQYIERKIHIVNDSNYGLPLKTFSKDEFFQKNARFFEDREYRYVFLEYSNKERTQYNTFNTDGVLIENLNIANWIKRPDVS